MTDNRGELVAELIDLGVPDNVAKELATQPRRHLLVVGYAVCLFALIGVMFFAVFGVAYLLLAPNEATFSSIDGLKDQPILVISNIGLSILGLAFASIFGGGALLNALLLCSGNSFRTLIVSSGIRQYLDEIFGRTILRFSLREWKSYLDLHDFSLSRTKQYFRWTLLIAFVLSVLSFTLFFRESRSGVYYSEHGYTRSPILPFGDIETRQWADAESVQVGCIKTRNSERIEYEVTWPDGKTREISEGGNPIIGTWLDAMTEIDSALRNSDARFKRWSWLHHDPLHPDCVRHYREIYTSDKERQQFDRLLRVGEFPTDKPSLGAK